MRTFKAGLIAASMVFAVAACGSDGGGGFPGLGSKTNQADGSTETSTPKDTQRPTSRPTGDDPSPAVTTRRPTTSAPRPTTASPTRGGGGNDWSPAYSANFTSGCLSTSNNNTKYCQCALTELQAKYSQAAMNAFDQEYARTNKLPAELQSTVQTCVNRG